VKDRIPIAQWPELFDAVCRRNALLVGALIGLLLGCLAAYLADPFLARRNQAAPA